MSVGDLHFTQRTTEIIRGMSFTSGRTGVTVIMGPNGAGKSVLLRLLHGLIQPTRGEVRWDGLVNHDDCRKQQSMVFQRPVLLRRSVQANLDFVVRHCAAQRTVDTTVLLEKVGLYSVRHRPARRLSGGEQQRLALARALVTDPGVLFLDEPTASLDPTSTLIIERSVAERSAAGTKVFFVTHDAGQAHRLADDVLFMHHGRLLEHTSADDFFNQPRTREARA